VGVHGEERTGLPPQGLALPLHALFLSVAATEGYEDWVALHAGGAFADHVAWVRSEIDIRGPTLTDSRQARLSALFEKVLEAEIAFHDAAYTA
jgi:thiaminase